MLRQIICPWLALFLFASLGDGSEVTLTTLSTVFLSPREVRARGVQGGALDPEVKLYYAASQDVINIIDLADPSNPVVVDTIEYPNPGAVGLSAALCGDNVYIAADTSPSVPPRRGVVYTFLKYDRDTGALPLVTTIDYGLYRYPRDLKLTRNCSELIVALENFADFTQDIVQDAPGQLGMVMNPGSKYSKNIVMDFCEFNDQLDELKKQGVRFSNNSAGVDFATQIEPSFNILSDDETTMYSVLQEVNAISVTDMETQTVTGIFGLGVKRWGKFDASDMDGPSINIRDHPGIYSFYQPDRIAFVSWYGEDYIITANEGQRQFIGPGPRDRDSIRGKDIPDSMIADSVPGYFRDQLKDDSQLGRLLLSTVDGLNDEGKYERFFMFGGRSFSIYRASDFSQVFDSGSDFEKAAAERFPEVFNSNIRFGGFTLESQFDLFSPLSGPEPENIVVGKVGEGKDMRLLIFIATERPGFIYVYSVSGDIRKPKFETLFYEAIPRFSNKTVEELNEDFEFKDIDPEVLEFAQPGVLAEYGVLIIGGGFSNTVSLVRVDVTPKEYYYPPYHREPYGPPQYSGYFRPYSSDPYGAPFPRYPAYNRAPYDPAAYHGEPYGPPSSHLRGPFDSPYQTHPYQLNHQGGPYPSTHPVDSYQPSHGQKPYPPPPPPQAPVSAEVLQTIAQWLDPDVCRRLGLYGCRCPENDPNC